MRPYPTSDVVGTDISNKFISAQERRKLIRPSKTPKPRSSSEETPRPKKPKDSAMGYMGSFVPYEEQLDGEVPTYKTQEPESAPYVSPFVPEEEQLVDGEQYVGSSGSFEQTSTGTPYVSPFVPEEEQLVDGEQYAGSGGSFGDDMLQGNYSGPKKYAPEPEKPEKQGPNPLPKPRAAMMVPGAQQDWQKQLVARFPELGVAGSEFNTEFVKAVKSMRGREFDPTQMAEGIAMAINARKADAAQRQGISAAIVKKYPDIGKEGTMMNQEFVRAFRDAGSQAVERAEELADMVARNARTQLPAGMVSYAPGFDQSWQKNFVAKYPVLADPNSPERKLFMEDMSKKYKTGEAFNPEEVYKKVTLDWAKRQSKMLDADRKNLPISDPLFGYASVIPSDRRAARQ